VAEKHPRIERRNIEMGLTIHYSFKAQGSEVQARKLIHALHQTAQDLPFQELGEVVELSGEQCNFNKRDTDDPLRWLLIQAGGSVKVKSSPRVAKGEWGDFCFTALPTQVMAFKAWPGEGCEDSNFGLCKYPAVIETTDGPHKTNLFGWRWSSFCKTQYASDPKLGGVTNFLQCHLTVIALLDKAKELGCLKCVSDEGHFWEKRDLEALGKEIGSWNEMMAAFGGCLKDMAGDYSGMIEMPISQFPNFEKLEAAGQDKLPPALAQLAKLARQVINPPQ
jgi:hypothetical protein